MTQNLHILSFDIPYPANYGGVIDVFYKLKTLHQSGAKIKLHCYQYGNRIEADRLNEYCEEVHLAPRLSPLKSLSLQYPYIVSSRQSQKILDKLLEDDAPILFEGLHTCYYLDHPKLKHRSKWVRMHNIEWEYYQALAQSEKNALKKAYFKIESHLLKRFEAKLQHAQTIFAISPNDQKYLQRFFKSVHYLPAFHSNEKIKIQAGQGNYALYHGNLGVNENHQAAMFLIEKVFEGLDYPLIIAGSNPKKELIEVIERMSHIQLVVFPSDEKLQELIQKAHINILPTFQATGIKLKLLNALYNGRFCLVNTPMVENTGLTALCSIADSKEKFREQIEVLKTQYFLEKDIAIRKKILKGKFSNQENAKILFSFLEEN